MNDRHLAVEVPIQVLIVDDHAIVRKGTRALLAEVEGIEVVGEAADGQENIPRSRSSHLRDGLGRSRSGDPVRSGPRQPRPRGEGPSQVGWRGSLGCRSISLSSSPH